MTRKPATKFFRLAHSVGGVCAAVEDVKREVEIVLQTAGLSWEEDKTLTEVESLLEETLSKMRTVVDTFNAAAKNALPRERR